MDELIDFWDLFDFGGHASDLGDLADVSDFADIAALGDIIDGIDFLPLDGTDVAAIVAFDPSDLVNLDFDPDIVGHASDALDIHPLGFETVDLDSLQPEMTGAGVDTAFLEALQNPDSVAAFSDYVGSTLDTYPQHLLGGLDYVEVPQTQLMATWGCGHHRRMDRSRYTFGIMSSSFRRQRTTS